MIAAFLVGAVAVAIPPQAPAAPPAAVVRMDAGQLLLFAARSEQEGKAALAQSAYEALTGDRRAEVRNEARLRLARLHALAGRRNAAATLLRRILDEQPQAAPIRFALAQLLVSIGDEPGAQRELRAVRAGDLPLDAARLVDRFSEALRVRKPIGGSFEVAVAPDSNVNRATLSDTVGTVIGTFDIGEEAQARSGVGLALRGNGYARVSMADGVTLLARALASADLYRQAGYNDMALALAAGPEFRLGTNRLALEVGGTHRWFGRRRVEESLHLSASLARPLDARTQITLAASAAIVRNRLNRLQSGRTLGGKATVEHALSPTTGVGLSLSGERQVLGDVAYSATGWRAALMGWRQVGRATLTAVAEVGGLAADERLALFPKKRADDYRRLSLGATLRQFSVGGFAPLVRLSYERNRSSVEFYDYARRRTEVGVTRAF